MLHNPLVDRIQARRLDRQRHAKFTFYCGAFIAACLTHLLYNLFT